MDTPISNYRPQRELVTISPEATLITALNTMRNERISSVPFNSHQISRVDIAQEALHKNLFDSETYFDEFQASKVKTLARPLVKIDGSVPLSQVLDILLKEQRCLCCDFVVTEMDFLKIIFKNNLLTNLMDYKVEMLVSNQTSSFDTISINQIALTAFEKLNQHNHKSLAVVNEQGSIVGHLGFSDFSLSCDMKQKVTVYLHTLHEKVWDLEPFVVSVHNTVRNAIEKLISLNVHQLWIVDDSEKPVHLITAHDILTLIAKNL